MSMVEGSGKLEKARLIIFSATLDANGALSRGAPDGPPIDFEYNPTELTFTRAAKWSMKAQRDAGTVTEPMASEPMTMNVEMFLDASEGGTVKITVERVVALTQVATGSRMMPQLVQFVWGVESYLLAVVRSVQVRYTRFHQSGVPIRALLAVTLQEFVTTPGGTNPTSGGRHSIRSYRLNVGDSLATVAQRELGSPFHWRAIAAFNGIDDPRRLEPGVELMIPSKAWLRRGAST